MVYYGIKHNILSIDIAQEFVCRKLEHDEPISPKELELAWHFDNSLDVLELIDEILGVQKNMDECMEKATEKIRIAIIILLRDTEKDIAKLLEQINVVYSQFAYPADMEEFVSYMPAATDYIPSQHTLEDNRNYLLSKLDCFIDKQMEKYQLERV